MTAARLRAAGEATLLAVVTLSVWPFAAASPAGEFAASVGVAVLVALWAAHAAVTRTFTLRPDAASVGLGGVVLLAAAQLVPLPEPVVGVLAPARLDWHRTLLPESAETLPGNLTPGPPRPTWLPLTVCPAATRTFVAQAVLVLALYAAARNWLASAAAFRRLAWAAAANGTALAGFAVAQAGTGPPDVVLGVRVDGASGFGPFVCRNHYPDYVALGLGLTAGLFAAAGRPPLAALGTARGAALAAAAGLMLLSIPLSLSRGGTLAVAAAGLLTWRRAGGGWRPLAAGLGGLAALAVFAGPAADRLVTLGSADAYATRLGLWRDAVALVPGSWLVGTGAGTFAWVEPSVRSRSGPELLFDSAHNEYLEALVEGGVGRLALTVGLAVGVLRSAARGRRDPLALGAWFGLATVAIHAVGDFAVRIPAVALLTAAVAGYATAPDPRPTRATVRGWAAAVAGLAVLLAVTLASADAWARLWSARPDDPDRLVTLAEARFAAGDEAGGLTASVAARAACPTHPRPHFLLARHAAGFASSEPAAVHLDRARRLLPADPTIWFRVGEEAFARGDDAAAVAAWRGSLERGPVHLGEIVRAAAGRVSPEAVRDDVLPPDAPLMLSAADLWPEAGDVFLRRAADLGDRPGATVADVVAAAAAHDRLTEPAAAEAAWRRALAAAPDDAAVRDGFAGWLEREERYAEAVRELEWLHARGAGANVRDRLDAAHHGAALAAELGR